jgi:hypothetical protein
MGIAGFSGLSHYRGYGKRLGFKPTAASGNLTA